jgi:hypothetical protein
MNLIHEEDVEIKRAGNKIVYRVAVCKSIDVKGIRKILDDKGPLGKILVFQKIKSADKQGRPTGINNKLRRLAAIDSFHQVDIIYCQGDFPTKEKMISLALAQIQNLADPDPEEKEEITLKDGTK